ncbi:hypothetical protein [Streptomyces subrutilus]|uniref:Uncharacterized protein n=1 Tax=Streptomyces subrutilus TaxID=36818 RepID=A0A1E5Q1D2_9ACTN|nr:hypothetical protein [Streptomyces subrutilus]OEJ35718.1 hypothetical protein BGK67_14690 [Streptomyces subrutilus]
MRIPEEARDRLAAVAAVYAPSCALVEADRTRPGTAGHLASLPGITILDLDLPAALAVARQETWAAAQSRYAARPTADRPDGAVVATTSPKRWEGEPVRILDLTP